VTNNPYIFHLSYFNVHCIQLTSGLVKFCLQDKKSEHKKAKIRSPHSLSHHRRHHPSPHHHHHHPHHHHFIGKYTNTPLLTQPQQGYGTKNWP